MTEISCDRSTGSAVVRERPATWDPLSATLIGEYLRLGMMGTALGSAIYWAARFGADEAAPPLIVSNTLIVCSLASHRLAGLARLAILFTLSAWLVATVATRGDWFDPIVFFSPLTTLCMLIMLAVRDVMIAFRRHFDAIPPRVIGIGLVLAAACIYLIVVPTIDTVLDQFEEQPTSFVVEGPTAFEMLRIRSAKLIVFSIFAYFGACVGSFLNVVAASAPRGESIALRSSVCPKCETPIRRFDNLPIVSYLMLQGRCRACQVRIPVRYLAVELIAMSIFASLFLYELVTGAANVPGFQHYHYTGILWIILYTKWPVIGIYFYHTFMFSCLLTFALMEADDLRCPRWMAVAIVVVFACLAVAVPVLVPVAFDDQVPVHVSAGIPEWMTQAITCLVGGLVGWLVAVVAGRVKSEKPPTISLILLGVTLGWQATITIAAIWTLASVAIGRLDRQRPTWLGATAMLFGAAMLHHPAWKWLTRFW